MRQKGTVLIPAENEFSGR
ncbi:Protein of unknown function [Bacillus cytotoxicus]|nr:Protein of unknown function [Bacillus cytotoxicus]